MPNPTAHADDMKSPAKTETMPAFWWLEPWTFAFQQWNARAKFYGYWQTTEDAYQAAKHVIKQKEDTANYHQNERNAFLRKVELALKPACPHLYEDTIGYVHWAADEIKALRASLSVMTEDRDAYIEKLEKATAGRTLLVSRDAQIDGLFADIEREKQKVEAITIMCNERDRQINTRDEAITELYKHVRSLKRKLAKAEKAKPLWENKTGGASFTYGNHEDRPIRAALGSINNKKTFLHGIPAKAKKAKKKGGAK